MVVRSGSPVFDSSYIRNLWTQGSCQDPVTISVEDKMLSPGALLDILQQTFQNPTTLTLTEERKIGSLIAQLLLDKNPEVATIGSRFLHDYRITHSCTESFVHVLSKSSSEIRDRINELASVIFSPQTLEPPINYAYYHLGELSALRFLMEQEDHTRLLNIARSLSIESDLGNAYAEGVSSALKLADFRDSLMKRIPDLAEKMKLRSSEAKSVLCRVLGLKEKWLDNRLFSLLDRIDKLTPAEMEILNGKFIELCLKRNPFAANQGLSLLPKMLAAFDRRPAFYQSFCNCLQQHQQKISARITDLTKSFSSEKQFFSHTYQHLGMLIAFSALYKQPDQFHTMLDPALKLKEAEKWSAIIKRTALAILHTPKFTESLLGILQATNSKIREENGGASIGSIFRILTLNPASQDIARRMMLATAEALRKHGVSSDPMRLGFNTAELVFPELSPEKAT